jgi:hypothetical protein
MEGNIIFVKSILLNNHCWERFRMGGDAKWRLRASSNVKIDSLTGGPITNNATIGAIGKRPGRFLGHAVNTIRPCPLWRIARCHDPGRRRKPFSDFHGQQGQLAGARHCSLPLPCRRSNRPERRSVRGGQPEDILCGGAGGRYAPFWTTGNTARPLCRWMESTEFRQNG